MSEDLKQLQMAAKFTNAHQSLKSLFGDRFGSIIAEPVRCIKLIMFKEQCNEIDAFIKLCKITKCDADPLGVIMYQAAVVEIIEGVKP